jgi:hypothetical protein
MRIWFANGLDGSLEYMTPLARESTISMHATPIAMSSSRIPFAKRYDKARGV